MNSMDCQHSGFHRTAQDLADCLRNRLENQRLVMNELVLRATITGEILRGLQQDARDADALKKLDAAVEAAR